MREEESQEGRKHVGEREGEKAGQKEGLRSSRHDGDTTPALAILSSDLFFIRKKKQRHLV